MKIQLPLLPLILAALLGLYVRFHKRLNLPPLKLFNGMSGPGLTSSERRLAVFRSFVLFGVLAAAIGGHLLMELEVFRAMAVEIVIFLCLMWIGQAAFIARHFNFGKRGKYILLLLGLMYPALVALFYFETGNVDSIFVAFGFAFNTGFYPIASACHSILLKER